MIVITSLFIVGHILIALEHPIKIEKAAVALVTGGSVGSGSLWAGPAGYGTGMLV